MLPSVFWVLHPTPSHHHNYSVRLGLGEPMVLVSLIPRVGYGLTGQDSAYIISDPWTFQKWKMVVPEKYVFKDWPWSFVIYQTLEKYLYLSMDAL